MQLNVALFGFGSVGSACAQYLVQNLHAESKSTAHSADGKSDAHSQSHSADGNFSITLKSIFTRSPQKILDARLDKLLIANNWQEIIGNKDINCIVELMGGIDFAKEIIIAALKAGKHVITANKALLAQHGAELFQLAKQKQVCIAFEASCGGGIPIIKAISEGLVANTHSALYGVMNGTCNFILTEMKTQQISFDEALELAMKLGLAEADPSLDIHGTDAGHKIALLAALAFKKKINFNKIPIKGIDAVLNKDIYFSSHLNYTMKLIAASMRVDNKLSVWVHPTLLPKQHPMTTVNGSFNAISAIGDEVGHTFYYGRGAGGKPTNSAIISDLVSIANMSYPTLFGQIADSMCNDNSVLTQTGIESLVCEVYLRIQVQDKPGTLTQITALLAKHQISIARVLQEDSPHSPFDTEIETPTQSSIKSKSAELIIITHHSSFLAVQNACKEIANLEVVFDKPSLYPIIGIPQDDL